MPEELAEVTDDGGDTRFFTDNASGGKLWTCDAERARA